MYQLVACSLEGSQWILGKSLDNFALSVLLLSLQMILILTNATITTTVNGEIRQQAKLEQMIFKPDALSNLYPSILHYRKVTLSLPVHLVVLYLVKMKANMVG